MPYYPGEHVKEIRLIQMRGNNEEVYPEIIGILLVQFCFLEKIRKIYDCSVNNVHPTLSRFSSGLQKATRPSSKRLMVSTGALTPF